MTEPCGSTAGSGAMCVKRGDTLRFEAAWTDEAGTALDLTGVAATFALRLRTASTPAITAACTVTAATGITAVEIDAEDTADLGVGQYLAEITTEWADGTVITTDSWRVQIVEDLIV